MKENTKKRGLIIGIVIIVLLLGIAAALFVRFYPGIRAGSEISGLLEPILSAENQSMDIDLKTEFSGEALELEAEVYILNQENTKYLVVEQNGHPFYIVDGMLLLENAKAYKLTDTSTESPTLSTNLLTKNLFVQIAAICEAVEVIRTEKGDPVEQLEYTAFITGAQAQELLSVLAPNDEIDLSAIETLSMKLVAQGEQLERIEIAGSANLAPNAVNMELVISDFEVLESDAYVIPENIQNTVNTVDKNTLFSITGDLFRLLQAFGTFSEKESLEGTVELRANCGIIQFQNSYDLSKLISGSISLENSKEIEGIPAVVALLCMEGDITCTQHGESYVYELQLQEDAMEQLAASIVPDIVNQVITLTNGTVIVVVENGNITSMDVNIHGNMQILLGKVDAEVGAKFNFLTVQP